MLKAKFNDLDGKLAKKGQAAERERERYAQARRNRPDAMKETGSAEAAAERVRDAARDDYLTADQRWQAAEIADPSRALAQAAAFVLSAVITGAGQWFIGNYLNSRLAAHEASLKAARARRRMRHSAKRLTRRKGQESRARLIMASMRAEYLARLEQAGLSAGRVKAMAEKAFGKTEADADGIVRAAVGGFREELRRDGSRGWFSRRVAQLMRQEGP